MRFNLLFDADWESGLNRVLDDLSNLGYRRHFEARHYDDGLVGVTVVLMCQDPALHLKRRVRYARAEKKLYMDIMLDLSGMKAIDHEARKRLVLDRLVAEVPAIIAKYCVAGFDSEHFVSDLRAWCEGQRSEG